MTRNGKIARLPRKTRDELNQRLEDGEPGVRLIEWLNGLPEVKQILDSEFEARPINGVNLTDWKHGGFLDWQARQEARMLLQGLRSDSDDLAKVQAAELADPLATVLMAQYTAACYRSNTDEAEEPRARVRRLGKSLRDIVRLRRCELARERARDQNQLGRERLALDREWLQLEQQKTDAGQRKKFMELANDPKIQDKLTPKMTPEEKAQAIYDRFFPKDEFEPGEPST